MSKVAAVSATMAATIGVALGAAMLAGNRMAFAETPPARPSRNLYVGLLAGEPTSVTLAAGIGGAFVAQGEFGASSRKDVRLVGAMDVVYWMPEVLGSVGERARLVPWFGLGWRVTGGRDDTGDGFGLRVPFGISWVTPDASIEAFLKVAPGLTFVPDSVGSFDGGLGVRVGL